MGLTVTSRVRLLSNYGRVEKLNTGRRTACNARYQSKRKPCLNTAHSRRHCSLTHLSINKKENKNKSITRFTKSFTQSHDEVQLLIPSWYFKIVICHCSFEVYCDDVVPGTRRVFEYSRKRGFYLVYPTTYFVITVNNNERRQMANSPAHTTSSWPPIYSVDTYSTPTRGYNVAWLQKPSK